MVKSASPGPGPSAMYHPPEAPCTEDRMQDCLGLTWTIWRVRLPRPRSSLLCPRRDRRRDCKRPISTTMPWAFTVSIVLTTTHLTSITTTTTQNLTTTARRMPRTTPDQSSIGTVPARRSRRLVTKTSCASIVIVAPARSLTAQPLIDNPPSIVGRQVCSHACRLTRLSTPPPSAQHQKISTGVMQGLPLPRSVPAMARSDTIDMPAWTRDISKAAKQAHNTRILLSLALGAFTSMPVKRVTDALQDWFLQTTEGNGHTLMAATEEPKAKGEATYEPTTELMRPKAL